MDDLPLAAKIVKSLIAPARHSEGPTLYMICSVDAPHRCVIYEQLPDGKCLAWPESAERGVQQAEGDELSTGEKGLSHCEILGGMSKAYIFGLSSGWLSL